MNMNKRLLLSLLLLLCFSTTALADWWNIERRKPQTSKEFDYAFMPYAMNMPGIGSWFGVAASTSNIAGTETDWFLTGMSGDLSGYVTVLTDVPLGTEHLTANYFVNKFSRASVQTYDRGMDSDPDKHRHIVADLVDYRLYMISLKLWDKRIQLYGSKGRGTVSLDYLLDIDGNKITDFGQNEASSEMSDQGFIFDYTDDRFDPRKGLRLEMRRAQSPKVQDTDPDYYRLDKALSAYVPMNGSHTLALGYYASDAVMQSEGLTDQAAIDAVLETMYQCNALTGVAQTACIEKRDQDAYQTWANNKYGTASSLGGTQFLRSYPQGRFYGAHARFMGVEYRWNMNEDKNPYDIYFAKGVRTILQWAAFAEQGTVADTPEDLGRIWRHSYGVGFRMLLLSGLVFRFDMATGEEGAQTTLFINYPWGVFY